LTYHSWQIWYLYHPLWISQVKTASPWKYGLQELVHILVQSTPRNQILKKHMQLVPKQKKGDIIFRWNKLYFSNFLNPHFQTLLWKQQ
jgi:hypothetical protein